MTAVKTFQLTLNKSDRAAIDWVGHRYSHGDELCNFLGQFDPGSDDYENDPWCLDSELTVELPNDEAVMSEYERLITEDNMACFSDELKHKLLTPLHHYLGGR